MFCPVCEAEYEAGIAKCPDDGSTLVDKLTPENSAHDSSEARYVVLHNFGMAAEAEMVNEILVNNGIHSVVKSGSDALSPLLSATSEGAAILVDERDYDRANEIYSAFFGADTTPLSGGVSETEDAE